MSANFDKVLRIEENGDITSLACDPGNDFEGGIIRCSCCGGEFSEAQWASRVEDTETSMVWHDECCPIKH